MMVRRDGTSLTTLTEGSPNAGFPSWSPDGTRVVYRVWGGEVQGLRIMNLADRSVQVLTTDYDNLPQWSPDGTRILFTRRHSGFNFDIFTIRPDGSDPQHLTTSPANDAHAVWTDDGQHVMWNSGMYGWKEEAALYDKTFQPYGQIFIMKADGTGLRQLTDSLVGGRHAAVRPRSRQDDSGVGLALSGNPQQLVRVAPDDLLEDLGRRSSA